MATINYSDCGNLYLAQQGVTIKTVRHDYEPGHPETMYVVGPDNQEYVPCRVDSFGNVCDESGIVMYPSGSGGRPKKKGDKGYFGYFRENFAPGVHPELPSIDD